MILALMNSSSRAISTKEFGRFRDLSGNVACGADSVKRGCNFLMGPAYQHYMTKPSYADRVPCGPFPIINLDRQNLTSFLNHL